MRPFPSTIALLLALALAGCGLPGAPQPPSLDLPRPPSDLVAVRHGDRVTLTWTMSRRTTDGEALRRLGTTRIRRIIAANGGPERDDVVAEVASEQLAAPGQRATFVDILPPEIPRTYADMNATYTVEVHNRRGRSAGLSNSAGVPLIPTLAPPADLNAAMSPEGVVLTWTAQPLPADLPGLAHFYRVYRRAPEAEAQVAIGEVKPDLSPQTSFVDRTFEWEQNYLYRVAPVTVRMEDGRVAAEVEGEASAAAPVLTRDVFPPAAPSGVQAVFAPVGERGFIDLTWAPNTEPDLAGYHVYRRSEGAQPERVTAEPVKAPAFRDEDVAPGQQYFYSVSAVDLRGNESPRSGEGSETVPERAATP